MLKDSKVTANIPAADLERARRFYADTLGLTPTGDNPGGLVFTTGAGTAFFVYETQFAGQAGHTIAPWHVADVPAEVQDLKARGLTFEHYDLPGVTWEGDVAMIADVGRAAWFKDSENNIMCIDDQVSA